MEQIDANDFNPQRVLVVGDLHGYNQHLVNAVAAAMAHDCDAILQVGDFGWWPNDLKDPLGFLEVLNFCGDYMPVFWIHGNHENLDNIVFRGWWQQDEFCVSGHNSFYIPSGHRWHWGEKSFCALGGAHSVDRHRRTEGFDWFAQERPTELDLQRCERHGAIDVLVCHDTAIDVAPFYSNKLDQTPTRRQISNLAKQLQTKIIFHGHHHNRFSEVSKFGYRTIGMDLHSSPSAYTIIDLWEPLESWGHTGWDRPRTEEIKSELFYNLRKGK